MGIGVVTVEIVKTNIYYPLKLAAKQTGFISSREKITKALSNENCMGFNAIIDDKIIGFALLREFEQNKYFLWDFIIDLKFQGQGKGKEFLNTLIQYLKDNYNAKMITTTYIYGNETAKKLYESVGFQQTDVVDDGKTHEVNMMLEVV